MNTTKPWPIRYLALIITALLIIVFFCSGCDRPAEDFDGDPDFWVENGTVTQAECDSFEYEVTTWPTAEAYADHFGEQWGYETATKWWLDINASYEKYCS